MDCKMESAEIAMKGVEPGQNKPQKEYKVWIHFKVTQNKNFVVSTEELIDN